MLTRRTTAIGISILIALFTVGLAVLGASLATGQVQAQTTEETGGVERFVEVTGVGRVLARPDRAIVRFGVETQADTAAAALEANNTQMSAVISATQEAGVEEANIQTQVVHLQPVYETAVTITETTETTGQGTQLVGYRAINVLEVTTSDLENLGGLLDTVVEAGSNRIESLQFEVEDQEALLAAAREQAVNNAQAQAEQLAELTGAELGAVRTIIDLGGSFPVPVRFETADAAAAVPIATGTQIIEVRVQVSWTLQ
jgi:uncharacterized protein YggE